MTISQGPGDVERVTDRGADEEETLGPPSVETSAHPGWIGPEAFLWQARVDRVPSAERRNLPFPPEPATSAQEAAPLKPWRQGPRDNTAPANLLDLADRFLALMNWETTLQFVVIVLAVGVTTGLVFGGLGLWVHFMLGTSPWWAAGLATVGGCGASGGSFAYFRRRRRKSTRRGESPEADDDGRHSQNGHPAS